VAEAAAFLGVDIAGDAASQGHPTPGSQSASLEAVRDKDNSVVSPSTHRPPASVLRESTRLAPPHASFPDTDALGRCVPGADTPRMWRRYLWPGLVGIGAAASGIILFVAGAAAGVDGVAAAGMVLAMAGFFSWSRPAAETAARLVLLSHPPRLRGAGRPLHGVRCRTSRVTSGRWPRQRNCAAMVAARRARQSEREGGVPLAASQLRLLGRALVCPPGCEQDERGRGCAEECCLDSLEEPEAICWVVDGVDVVGSVLEEAVAVDHHLLTWPAATREQSPIWRETGWPSLSLGRSLITQALWRLAGSSTRDGPAVPGATARQVAVSGVTKRPRSQVSTRIRAAK